MNKIPPVLWLIFSLTAFTVIVVAWQITGDRWDRWLSNQRAQMRERTKWMNRRRS